MSGAFLDSPLAALEYVAATLAQYPERQALPIRAAARSGLRRRDSGLCLNYLAVPEDHGQSVDAVQLPEIETPVGADGELARQMTQVLRPLSMLNPVSPVLALGKGVGTLVPSFGIPLDAATDHSPAYTMSLEDALKQPVPCPTTSGLLPEIHERIDFIKSRLPAGRGFYMNLPNMQGLFNLAHAILGEDAMIGPLIKPELYREFMLRMTDFWIGAWRQLHAWIGPEWMTPDRRDIVHLGFCSVNLVSTDFYLEHVLPYDLRLARELDFPLSIHPCSGPHVFRATLEQLPNVVATQAGFIEKTAAGAISVDAALDMIGTRPIALDIGQELPQGDEFEFIRRDFDRYAEHPRLTFSYTGMHWRIRDRERIQSIHRHLDDYWRSRYGGEGNELNERSTT